MNRQKNKQYPVNTEEVAPKNHN